jgi:hypothetical protein
MAVVFDFRGKKWRPLARSEGVSKARRSIIKLLDLRRFLSSDRPKHQSTDVANRCQALFGPPPELRRERPTWRWQFEQVSIRYTFLKNRRRLEAHMALLTKLAHNSILPLFLIVASSAGASAATRITITFDDIAKEVEPINKEIRIPNSRKFTLDKDNNMGTVSSSNHDTMGALGRQGHGTDIYNVTYAWTLRIVSGVLFIVNDYPGFTSLTKIRTNGTDSCTATRDYRKKRGQFRLGNADNFTRTMSDMHTENMTCSIERIPD